MKPQKEQSMIHCNNIIIKHYRITHGRMISSSSTTLNNNNKHGGDNNHNDNNRNKGCYDNTWNYSSFLIVSSSVGYWNNNNNNMHYSTCTKKDEHNNSNNYKNYYYDSKRSIEGTIPLAYSPRQRKPPQWGSSLPIVQQQQQYSNTAFQQKKIESPPEEDCPLCQKYSQGPCGSIFKKWLSCTDQYQNMTHPTTGEELHLTKCSDIAEKLAHCMNEHVEYYKRMDVEKNQEHIKAWSQFITDFKTNHHHTNNKNNQTIIIDLTHKKTTTPPKQPQTVMFHVDIEMQLHLKSQTGISVLKEDDNDSNSNYHLLCMFVQDENETILGATSADELYQHHDTLRFQLHKDTSKQITTVALYEHKTKQNEFLWIQKMQLLPLSQSSTSSTQKV